jgi:hypothetical protein
MKQAVRRHALAQWAGFYVIGRVVLGHISASEDVVRVQGGSRRRQGRKEPPMIDSESGLN